MAEYCSDPEVPSRPRCCRKPGEAGVLTPTRGTFPARAALFLRPGLAAAPGAAPARAGSGREAGCTERSGPHLPVLREGDVRHGLASLPVPGHLGDRAGHVCKAKHTREEARPGRSADGLPLRATATLKARHSPRGRFTRCVLATASQWANSRASPSGSSPLSLPSPSAAACSSPSRSRSSSVIRAIASARN